MQHVNEDIKESNLTIIFKEISLDYGTCIMLNIISYNVLYYIISYIIPCRII